MSRKKKDSPTHPLDWTSVFESYTFISSPPRVSSVDNLTTPFSSEDSSSITQGIATSAVTSTCLESPVATEMPRTSSSVLISHRVPFPMTDFPMGGAQHIPVEVQSSSYEEYSYSHHTQSFHELRPPEKEKILDNPTSSFSTYAQIPEDTDVSSRPLCSPSYSKTKPQFFSEPLTYSGRRSRRGRRRAIRQQSPYSRPQRQVIGRSSVRRPRRSRRGVGRHISATIGHSSFRKYHEVVKFETSSTEPEIPFDKSKVYVKITEQPQAKALRFRYSCEGRSAGSIPGQNSTPENKTYPTIKIMNYKGAAMAVVSCVTVDQPYRPHPHNLVGKEGCEGGVCSVMINNETMECSFSNLGIQCAKKRDIEKSLTQREDRGIDPFSTGFSHRDQPQNIDLNAVRLCFQVYLKDIKTNEFYPVSPVVSEPIYDKKATLELTITNISDCSSGASGKRQIILLCDKIAKDDIKVRFFEVKENRIDWEAFGDFQLSDVHKQVAITFKTPPYRDPDIKMPVKVYVQLFRPSDRSNSKPRPFFYYPVDSGQYGQFVPPMETELKEKIPEKSLSPSIEDVEIKLEESFSSSSSSPERTYSKVIKSFIPSAKLEPKHKTPKGSFVKLEDTTHKTSLTKADNSKEKTSQYISSSFTKAGQVMFQSTQQTTHLQHDFSSFSTGEPIAPIAEYQEGSAICGTSQSSFKAEELLDLDTQHLVQDIEHLPDLGIIYSRDLYSAGPSSIPAHVSKSNITFEERKEDSESFLNIFPPPEEESIEKQESSNSSSNSDSVKKLKMELETLNKLSR